MIRFEQYTAYSDRLNGARRSYTQVPSWGRAVLTVAAVPGILLLGLSAAMFVLSIAALLLLTAPAYLLVARLSGASRDRRDAGEPSTKLDRPPARPVQATVID